jgi:hypothetical protein
MAVEARLGIEVQQLLRRFNHDQFTLRIDSSADSLRQWYQQLPPVRPSHMKKIDASGRLYLGHRPQLTMLSLFSNDPASHQVRDVVMMSRKLRPFFMPDQNVKVAEAIRLVNRIDTRELQDDSALMCKGVFHFSRLGLTVRTLQKDLPHAVEARRKIGEDLGRHFSPAALRFDDTCDCQEFLGQSCNTSAPQFSTPNFLEAGLRG